MQRTLHWEDAGTLADDHAFYGWTVLDVARSRLAQAARVGRAPAGAVGLPGPGASGDGTDCPSAARAHPARGRARAAAARDAGRRARGAGDDRRLLRRARGRVRRDRRALA